MFAPRFLVCVQGPSIYDSQMEGEAQVDACGWGSGVQLHVDVHTES